MNSWYSPTVQNDLTTKSQSFVMNDDCSSLRNQKLSHLNLRITSECFKYLSIFCHETFDSTHSKELFEDVLTSWPFCRQKNAHCSGPLCERKKMRDEKKDRSVTCRYRKQDQNQQQNMSIYLPKLMITTHVTQMWGLLSWKNRVLQKCFSRYPVLQ